jgi:hypothetical protein
VSGYLQNFNPTNGFNILRIVCEVFFIPGEIPDPGSARIFCGGEIQAAGWPSIRSLQSSWSS